jgi:hypothetical protein
MKKRKNNAITLMAATKPVTSTGSEVNNTGREIKYTKNGGLYIPADDLKPVKAGPL